MTGKVAIVMGSKSDAEIMRGASDILTQFGIESQTFVISAHRTPQAAFEFATTAEDNGFEVIIAGAGGAAHLPGVLAGLTPLPVIGVPVKSAALSGLDSLLAIVQMPSGVPVATVAIDGAKNAGILAAQILSVKYPKVREAVREHKAKLAGAGAVQVS
ncbi:MAG: 5-(carboxyamino)imidazole ribonucleotide mutase [Armatimonadetes bacterium]|nr:5-(carboxyamino)imidazole ribonucleotide mutase [Armatimonadota bacterium]